MVERSWSSRFDVRVAVWNVETASLDKLSGA